MDHSFSSGYFPLNCSFLSSVIDLLKITFIEVLVTLDEQHQTISNDLIKSSSHILKSSKMLIPRQTKSVKKRRIYAFKKKIFLLRKSKFKDDNAHKLPFLKKTNRYFSVKCIKK